MATYDSSKISSQRLRRRTIVKCAATLLGVPFAGRAFGQDKLAGSGEVVLFGYGGSWTDGVRRLVYEPFSKATGIKVVEVTADFAEPQANSMFRAGRVDWDVAYIQAQNFPALQQAGMFLPLDYGLWDEESIAGTAPHTRLKDAFVAYESGEALAYDERAFPGGAPKNWAEYWDARRFPGPRGFHATLAKKAIQYALLADGVPRSDIWPLTDAKLDRAFKKLDQIKPQVAKWWIAGGEPVQLLLNREYAATSAPANRVTIAIRQGAPLKFTWEGAYLNYNYGVALKGGPNSQNAQKFIAFLNRAQTAAGWTQGGGNPGMNRNQLKHLPADLAPLLSVNPENASKAVVEDAVWLAGKRSDGKTNAEYIQERWLAWRQR